MTQIAVQIGSHDDVDAAVSIYERSNLARRRGVWPSRSSRIAQVTAHLRAAAAWFLIGRDGDEAVAMALVHPFRASGGTGDVIPGTLFLNLIYVLPDRWGQGIGGTMLDAVIAEGARRGCHRIYLWTHEHQNERAHRLYQSRRFAQTGRTAHDDAGTLVGEWLYDGTAQLWRAALMTPRKVRPPHTCAILQAYQTMVHAHAISETRGAMAQRNEALATAFEQVARRIVTAAESLSDAAWDVVPAGEARTAGQIAHHMANVYRNVGGFIQLAVAGQPLPVLTIADIHDRNAEQAALAIGVGRAGTLELLRQNGADTTALLRTLSDAQLDTATVFLGYPMTVERLAQNALVGHTEEHLASIQSAAASAA